MKPTAGIVALAMLCAGSGIAQSTRHDKAIYKGNILLDREKQEEEALEKALCRRQERTLQAG